MIITEYRARLTAFQAVNEEYQAELTQRTRWGDAFELLQWKRDRAFLDLEDLRCALRPGHVHRGAYIGFRGEAGQRPHFSIYHADTVEVRRVRDAIQRGEMPPRREPEDWELRARRRLAAAA